MPQVLDPEESAFLKLINNLRQSQNPPIAPLKVSQALTRSAKWKSQDMANNNYFQHSDLNPPRDPQTRMKYFGYNHPTSTGENIAAGFRYAQDAYKEWLTACDGPVNACTYAHRANMLNSNYKVIGIGRAFNANSDYKWYWTTDFGGYLDQTIETRETFAPIEQFNNPSQKWFGILLVIIILIMIFMMMKTNKKL